MPPLRSIAVFYYVARLNSISQAASELNVTPSAVSQQIKVLEEQIGTTLITRSGRSIRLTEAGEQYFELVSEKIDGIFRATEIMSGTRSPPDVIIRTTPTISTKWLLPRLSGLLEEMPRSNVRIDGSNEPVDFNRDNVDIEIRHGRGGWPGLHAEPLTEERFFPVCSPRLAGAGTRSPEETTGFPLIRSVKAQIQWSDWFSAQNLATDAIRPRLSFDRSHMAVEAAALGLGVALESELMMEAELRSGRLVMPVSRSPDLQVATQWLVCPRSNLRRRKVMKIIEWLRAQASAWESQRPAEIEDYLKY